MKKFGQFIISLVQPRKLAKYRNMHIALSFLVFLLGMFIALGSQYMMSDSFVEKEMPRTEFKNTLESLYINPTTNNKDDVSGLYFRDIQKLAFSSNLDFALDDQNAASKITSEVLTEKFTHGELNTPIEVQIYFDSSFVDYSIDDLNETNEAVINSKAEPLAKFCEDNINNLTPEKIIFFFGKTCVYYMKSSQLPLLIQEDENYIQTGEFTGFEILKFIKNESRNQYLEYNDDINEALSYLRRIPQIFRQPSQPQIDNNTSYLCDNVDDVSFVSKMFEAFELDYSNISYVTTEKNLVPYTLYSETYFQTLGIYHKVMKDTYYHEDGDFLDFTLVIDQNLNNHVNGDVKLKYFDYEGYMKQSRDANTTYVLCVLGFDRLFYIYDLGQDRSNGYTYFDYSGNSIFELTSGGNYKYFVPKDETEISYNIFGEVDTTKWTVECGKDDYSIINNVKYDAQNRHKDNFYNAVYTTHSRSYLYSDLVGDTVTNSTFSRTTKIDVMIQSVVDQMIRINASNYELVYAIMAFLALVLFPILLMFIVWLMSKKLYMKRIRQYYSIAALCYGATSIPAFIVGFFLPFDSFVLFLMFFQAWWFIFVTYRINTDPKYNNENSDDNDDNDKAPQKNVTFRKLKEVENIKPSQIG